MNRFLLTERLRAYVHKLISDKKGLLCLQRLLWRWRDDDYLEAVLKAGYDPNTMEMRTFGNDNLEKNIYFIEINGEMGLGGYLRHTLHALFEAEKLGFVPVVRYADNCPCKEIVKINGTDNPFEYYFNQTSSVSVEEVYRSSRVFLFKVQHLWRIERELGNLNPDLPAGYHVEEAYLKRMALLVKKYIRLNCVVEKKLKEDEEELFRDVHDMGRVLGIHIRGTDFALQWKNHPNIVSHEDYFIAVDKALSQGFSHIFLATDDSRYVERFEERYGSKLLYYKEVYRSDGICNIAFENRARDSSPYDKGMDVLRDMYALARCGGLIAGLSQVSIMARILSLSMERHYTYLDVLNNGIYKG